MTTPYNKNLFGTIDKFIRIRILDKEYEIPEKLELLRVFQFLDFKIDYARLCWNGSCHRCVVSVENSSTEETVEGLSCRLKSCEGMVLKKIASTIKPL